VMSGFPYTFKWGKKSISTNGRAKTRKRKKGLSHLRTRAGRGSQCGPWGSFSTKGEKLEFLKADCKKGRWANENEEGRTRNESNHLTTRLNRQTQGIKTRKALTATGKIFLRVAINRKATKLGKGLLGEKTKRSNTLKNGKLIVVGGINSPTRNELTGVNVRGGPEGENIRRPSMHEQQSKGEKKNPKHLTPNLKDGKPGRSNRKKNAQPESGKS